MPRTIFFDVNETLSDPAPLGAAFAAVGASGTTATTWLASTLRDGFALSMTTGPRPFPEVARQTLTTLLDAEPELSCSVDDGVGRVMAAFTTLPVHADVPDGVRRLHDRGHRLVALSNGTVEYARDLLGRAGVAERFDAVLSVDDTAAWKPDRRVYEDGLARTGTAPADAVLVAVHPWDLHGARAAGMTTVHLDRSRAPWPTVFDAPDVRVHALPELELD